MSTKYRGRHVAIRDMAVSHRGHHIQLDINGEFLVEDEALYISLTASPGFERLGEITEPKPKPRKATPPPAAPLRPIKKAAAPPRKMKKRRGSSRRSERND